MNYRTGGIIVEAASVEEARHIARQHFDLKAAEAWYSYDEEEKARRKALFEGDIAVCPEEIDGCIFISGSE